MAQAIIVALISGLLSGGAVAALVTGILQRRKTSAEARKTGVDADHVVVDTASDAVMLVKQVYEGQIEAMKRDIAEVKAALAAEQSERAADRRMIIDLNKQIGILRQAGEMAGQQIQLLLARIDELLSILRTHGIPFPVWAQAEAH